MTDKVIYVYNNDDFRLPSSLNLTIYFFKELESQIPLKYKNSSFINYYANSSYEYDTSYTLQIGYTRPETQEEEQERLDRELLNQERIRAYKLNEYYRLRKELGLIQVEE